jgi:hypothetical protein
LRIQVIAVRWNPHATMPYSIEVQRKSSLASVVHGGLIQQTPSTYLNVSKKPMLACPRKNSGQRHHFGTRRMTPQRRYITGLTTEK